MFRTGILLTGPAEGRQLGAQLAIGDVNGDGRADVIASARDSVLSGFGGEVAVRFNAAGGPLATTALNGANGFRILGDDIENTNNGFGASVAVVEDVNDDGREDIAIGAFRANNSSTFRNPGNVYVVFGDDAPGATLGLDALDGTNGFRLNGSRDVASFGFAVAPAGDLDGDGNDDLLVGSPNAGEPFPGLAPNSGLLRGEALVLWGGDEGVFEAEIDASDVPGADGFRLIGDERQDNVGFDVALLGDLDGDGREEIGILVLGDGPDDGGSVIVIRGQDSRGLFDAVRSPGALDAAVGARLTGLPERPSFLAALGDVSGDDVEDFAIGGRDAAAIVYGDAGLVGGGPLPADATMLADTAGGEGIFAAFEIGDVNDDDLDDFALSVSGGLLIVLGRRGGFGAEFDPFAPGDGRFLIERAANNALIAAGGDDLTGDAIDDLVVADPNASPDGLANAGVVYLVAGRSDALEALDAQDGAEDGVIALESLADAPPAPDPVPDPGGDDPAPDPVPDGGGDDPAPDPSPAPDDPNLGGDGDDNLVGGDAAERFDAGAGDDSVVAGDGDDTVSGGDGDDTVKTGDGNDRVNGDAGADVILSGNGDDVIRGGDGDDNIKPGRGDDTVIGGDGDDVVAGFRGDERFEGGEGNDRLLGSVDDDTLIGGAGDDRLWGGPGFDVFVFEERDFGRDTLPLDVRVGSDTLDFTAVEGLTRDDFTIRQVGSNVVLEVADGGSLVMNGVRFGGLFADVIEERFDEFVLLG